MLSDSKTKLVLDTEIEVEGKGNAIPLAAQAPTQHSVDT